MILEANPACALPFQDQEAADARAQHLVTNWQRRDAELPDAIPPGRGRDEDYSVGPLWDRGALRAIANGSVPVTEVSDSTQRMTLKQGSVPMVVAMIPPTDNSSVACRLPPVLLLGVSAACC